MHGSHGLFRKGWPFEESVRVPLLVRSAGPARRDDGSVSLVTLQEMALAWAEGAEDPFATGADRGAVRISMPSIVRLPDQCDRMWRGVRTATRKLILNDDGSPWLFYDLETDPLELRNLAGDPSRATQIAGLASGVSS
jgi:arylsulfatase A-like enzyme